MCQRPVVLTSPVAANLTPVVSGPGEDRRSHPVCAAVEGPRIRVERLRREAEALQVGRRHVAPEHVLAVAFQRLPVETERQRDSEEVRNRPAAPRLSHAAAVAWGSDTRKAEWTLNGVPPVPVLQAA